MLARQRDRRYCIVFDRLCGQEGNEVRHELVRGF